MGRRRLSATAAAWVVVLAGCTSFPRNDPGNGYGFITVSSPRVEGRERLINDRREQERWLRDQLDKLDSATFGVSGAVDLRSLSSISGQLGVDVDPTRKLNALNLGRTMSAAQQSADDEKALSALRAAQRDKIIADVQSGSLSLADAQTKLSALGLNLSASPASTASAPTSSASAAFALKPGSSAASASAPSDDPRRTSITSTPIEEFSDRLAAREVIRNELNDIRLDDLHDLSGNSLVRLTFDTTMLPESDASAWGLVRMKVKLPEPDMKQAKRLLDRAKDQYILATRESAETTYRSLLNRMNDNCFNQEKAGLAGSNGKAQQEAFYRAFVCATSNVGSNTRRAMERHAASVDLLDFKDDAPAATPAQGRQKQPQKGSTTQKPDTAKQPDEAASSPASHAARLRTQALLLNRPSDGESTADFEYRKNTLAKWAIWTGQVMDALLQEEFQNSVLSCFFDLKVDFTADEKSPTSGSAPQRLRVQGPSGLLLSEKTKDSAPPGKAGTAAENAELASRCTAAGDNVPEKFRNMLIDSISGTVYAVTPKESVQRISEVSSSRKAAEFLLGLSGNAGAAGIQAALQSIKVNEAFSHALRRQPLVVGFTENGRVTSGAGGAFFPARQLESADAAPPDLERELSFGWILGPSFQLSNDGKSTRYRHIVAQRSVAAELSVPSWMDKVQISYETYWVREDGTIVRQNEQSTTAFDGTPVVKPPRVHGRSNRFEVSLASSSVAALSAIDDQYLRVPKVDDFQYLDVEEGKPAAVMITGRNVWRSTEVFIGAQPARQLNILPDNRGVVATFGEMQPPYGSARAGKAGDVSLSLVTSEGRVVAGRVSIHPAQKELTPGPVTVSGLTTRLVAGVEYRAVLSRPAADADKIKVRIKAPQDKDLNADLGTAIQVDTERKGILFTVPATAAPKLKSGDKVTVQVDLEHANGAIDVLPLLKTGIYYASAADAQAKISAARATGKPVIVTFDVPASANAAFESLKSGFIKFSTSFDSKPLTGQCQISGKKCVGELKGDAEAEAALKAAKNADLKLKIKLVGEDVPAVTPEEVTVP